MKRSIPIAMVLFLAMSWCMAQNQPVNTCVSCHQQQDPPLSTPVEQMKGSVHDHPQLGCVGCHGGDASEENPELSMSRKEGFVGKPSASGIPKLCAKCHSNATYMRNFNPNISVDQYERYLTSQHGLLLAKGDMKVAVCTSCHGIHDIKRADDPTTLVFPTNIADLCGRCHANGDYMKGYSIKTSQVNDYKTSVHARMLYEKGDLSAPTCNDCHGNHGAMPPGIASIANVCGTCHFVQADHFSSSPHKPAFDELGISECEACHGNHAIQSASDKMIGDNEPATCIQCHDPGSKGYEAALLMRTAIDNLSAKIALADSLFGKAHRAGVEIGDESLLLPNAKDALIQARVLVHTFSSNKVSESTASGLKAADQAVLVGQQALKEVGHRRQLLALMVVLTLLVAGFLVFYIRARERRA